MRADLGFDAVQASWVITAYALAFGGLLVLGGRASDRVGATTRAFLVGASGFAGAASLAALAPGFAPLVAARGLEGVLAALLAPAAPSLLTTSFPTGPARTRACGVFATVGVSGSALGVLLGGVLTEQLGWRCALCASARAPTR